MSDGGRAFPGFNYVSSEVHDGMTLRDYFAAAALQGYFAGYFEQAIGDPLEGPDGISGFVYRIADAMVKERAK